MTSPLLAVQAALEHRYHFERELGSGGMASVYLARDVETGREVAVKVLKPELWHGVGAERFAREVRIISHLHHPNLVPVLDGGEAGGLPYLVMPYVTGGSLAERLKREISLPIDEAIRIAVEIADALQFVHKAGFLHRDVKPSNVLLSDGHAMLADFGIARALDVVTGERVTESGIAVGTPSYMSPEQASSGTLDGRSDVYSLGCVLYEMLAGEPPFTGPTAQSLRARHASAPIPDLRIVRSTVNQGLQSIIRKALAKVPADRFADAAQFRETLRTVDLSEATAVVTAGRADHRRRQRIAALAAVVAGAAAVGWGLTRSTESPLDPHRVMVYPLVAPGRVGEDVATMIGTALDGVGPLRWIDGWTLLDSARRDDIRSLSLRQARDLARRRRCAWFLTGRLVERGDSADVYLELNAVAGDSTAGRSKASGLATDAWRTGLHAVNRVLPALIPGDPLDLVAGWDDRDPGAIASFLLGEREFRRLHLADALSHYRAAADRDSTFALAAIRGAQAATWIHHQDQAEALVAGALRQPMPERYQHFARGYQAYLAGAADSAAAELRRALALDPEMTVAWLQLGETYTHLLPSTGNPDSLAETAFEQAHALDSAANGLLLHLIESRLRKGDTTRAAALIRDFLALAPDSTLAAQIRSMEVCLRAGPEALRRAPPGEIGGLALLAAGNSLKGGGAQMPCALAAFEMVIRSDTTAVGDLRWFAVLQVQSALLAQGRTRDAMARIDAADMRGEGRSMYLLDAPVYPELAGRAEAAAKEYRNECGPGYRQCGNPVRLWQLGVWEASQGRPEVADSLAAELGRRTPRLDLPRERYLLPVVSQSLAAHAALARGDTSAAVAGFEALLQAPVPGEFLTWDVASPRGLDRLRLSEVLLALGQYRRAIEVGSVFESAWPSVFLLYLPASLRVRAEAAEFLGDGDQARGYRARLAALTGSREVAASR